jgi:putative addiction module component (TIGR02574 family)
METQFSQLFALSVPQKLQLVGDLWDSIAATPEAVPVPQWQIEELDRRRAELQQNPELGIPWEEAKERLRRSHE